MANLFDFLTSINQTKEYLLVDALAEKEYSPYMINRGLSLFPDTVLFANEMNRHPDLPKKWNYEFYINSITTRKRFSKWPKKIKESEDLELVSNFFKCSYEKSRSILPLLDKPQLNEIRKLMDVGGRK